MELCPNNKPYVIYLSHHDLDFQDQVKKIILRSIKNVVVKTFSDVSEIDYKEEIDLIIVDLIFDDKKIEKLNSDLIKSYNQSCTPYLFLTTVCEFDVEKITFFNDYPDVIFDFINEVCFNKFVFINKIKVLLNIPKIIKSSNIQSEKMQINIWSLLDYSNFFIVMLDRDLRIKTINYHLAKTLGYDNEVELIGDNWAKFLKTSDKDIISHVHDQVLKKNKNYTEFTSDILDVNKNSITVKWFNVLINSSYNWIFSIGIPLTKEPTLEEDIDSIRSYFKNILEKDQTTINVMREVAKKNIEKTFTKIHCKESDCTKCLA